MLEQLEYKLLKAWTASRRNCTLDFEWIAKRQNLKLLGTCVALLVTFVWIWLNLSNTSNDDRLPVVQPFHVRHDARTITNNNNMFNSSVLFNVQGRNHPLSHPKRREQLWADPYISEHTKEQILVS